MHQASVCASVIRKVCKFAENELRRNHGSKIILNLVFFFMYIVVELRICSA